jgi:2-oxo-4-hydroxy-4-carboxy--5-ureidoimidazoline (OHCU) decarboxylase
MSEALIDPARLGTLGRADLAEALRPLWEDAGPLVERMVGQTVTSWDQHLALADAAIAAMDAHTQTELLAAHPRIGADPAALSPASYREQAAATATAAETLVQLEALNQAYEDRFGFPFVEFVAGRSKEAIVGVLQSRLAGTAEAERRAGCDALLAIAHDRLGRLQRAEPRPPTLRRPEKPSGLGQLPSEIL